MVKYEIHGHVSPGYEPVLETFREHFEQGREENAQCCAYVGEEKVVDIWGTTCPESGYNGTRNQKTQEVYVS